MPNKSKQKKWRKGQSCVTNPEKSTHRAAARNRFFRVQTGASCLTIDAVEKHEAKEEETAFEETAQFDKLSISGLSTKTGATAATNLTNCTNVSFEKIIQRFSTSNVAAHKEVLSVLAAMSEVIRGEGASETDTAYFALLMSSLNSDTFQNDQSLSAALFLLGLVIKRVPSAVLKSSFSDTVKVLLKVLVKQTDTAAPSLYRSVLVCLSELLKVQDLSVWNEAETQHVYQAVLSLVISSKAKVRKVAHECVSSVLHQSACMSSLNAPDHHPVASLTASFCVSTLRGESQGHATASLHTLELLKSVMGEFTRSQLKTICETLLQLMTLSNMMLREVTMKTFSSMFSSERRHENLTADYNAKIITALHDYKPDDSDTNAMKIWLDVMLQAHLNLFRLDVSLALGHLPRIFLATFKCLQTSALAKTALNTITTLLTDCIEPARDVIVKMIVDCQASGATSCSTPIHKIMRCVESGLGYQYFASWDMVLTIIMQFFEILGKNCNMMMRKCLKSLAELRDSSGFQYKDQLDKAIGMAVKTMGPKVVLETIPLGITGDSSDNLMQSWLLPVIRDHVQGTQLSFFISYFLPLAEKMDKKIIELRHANRSVEWKVSEALQAQIWSLLPGFCTRPTDITESFPLLAKTFGTAIRDKPSSRLELLNALRKLINSSMEKENEQQVVARYAQNFLPILFNLYLSQKSQHKDASLLAVLETIKVFLKITNETLLQQYSDMCYEKLSNPDIESDQKYLLMDIAIRLVPHLNEASLNLFLNFACEQIKNSNKTQQKKAYRILEEIFSGRSETCQRLVALRLKSIQEQLVTSLSCTSPSSKAARLHCIMFLIKHLNTPSFELIKLVLPEVVLCTKATGVKARQAAFSLLTDMAHTYIDWSTSLTDADALCKYTTQLMAGLAASSPHLIACTLLALTRIMFDLKDGVSMQLLTAVVDSLTILLTSNSREVIQAALGLVKALFSAFANNKFSHFLHKVVSKIMTLKEPMRLHFRTKIKNFFTRLVRKYGFELVVSMVPESERKFVSSIHKANERAKRLRKTSTAMDTSDEDEDTQVKSRPESFNDVLQECHSNDDDVDYDMSESKNIRKDKSNKKTRREKKGAWLKEDEDIVDFMDSSAAKKIITTRPSSKTVVVNQEEKSREGSFKRAADGRLIITDQGADSIHTKGSLSQPIEKDMNVDLLSSKGKNLKRKQLEKESFSNEEEDNCKKMKYTAGGHGIHRPVKKMSDKSKDYQSKPVTKDHRSKEKLDPYVYLPLKFQSLNKRKKAKSSGQFKNLVKGARQGASKGQKLRRKKEKN